MLCLLAKVATEGSETPQPTYINSFRYTKLVRIKHWCVGLHKQIIIHEYQLYDNGMNKFKAVPHLVKGRDNLRLCVCASLCALRNSHHI